MATTTERLAILITADGKGAARELQALGRTAEKELGKVEQGVARTQAQMQKFGVTALGVAGVAAVGLTELGRSASELEQAMGGAEAVFGSALGSVEDFSQGAAQAFGLSSTAALQLTSRLGSLLKGFGFTQEEAAGTSIRLSQLGADLSAAFGGRPEEAVNALGAALRGEYDPLERFGVSLNATQANLKAVELGLAENASSVDLNARAQAALAIIYERTTDVQGQFARESDTAAGKAARAAAEFENMKASLGQGVLPAMTAVLGAANSLVGGLTRLNDATGGIAAQGAVVATGLLAFTGAASLAISQSAALTGGLVKMAQSAQLTAGALQAGTLAMSGMTLAAGAGGVAILGAVAALTLFESTNERAAARSRELQEAADAAFNALAMLGTNTGAFDELVSSNLSAEGLAGDMNDLGLSIQQVTNIIKADSATQANWQNMLRSSGEAGQRVAGFVQEQSNAYRQGYLEAVRFALANEKVGAEGLKAAAAASLNEQAQASLADAIADGVINYQELDAIDVPALLAAVTSQFGAGAVGANNLAGATNAAGNSAQTAAGKFAALASAVANAFGAGNNYARAQLGIENANARVAKAQQEVAGTAKAAGGGTKAAGESALDAERKTRQYDAALRGVDESLRRVDDAHEGVVDAERGVEDANRGVEDAVRGVTEATRAYEDALLSQQDAVEHVAEAERGVQDALHGVEEAHRAVAQAAQSTADAERAVGDAQKDNVEAATDLADANDRLRLITQGYGAASQEAADAAEELSDAQRAAERSAMALGDAEEKLNDARGKESEAVEFFGADSDQAQRAAREVAKAQLDLRDAQDRVEDTTKGQDAAQRKLTGTLFGFAAGSDEATEAQEKVAAAQDRVDQTSRSLESAVRAVEEAHHAEAEAARGVEEADRRVIDAQRGVTDAHRAVEQAGRTVEDRHRAIAEADRAVEEAHRRVKDATDAVTDANRTVTEALLGVEDANFRVREAEEARTARLGGGGGGGGGAVIDQAQLERDLKAALLDQRDAYVEVATAAGDAKLAEAERVAALRGETIPDQEKANIKMAGFVEELYRQRDTLEPGSPLRQALNDYIWDLGELPDEVSTKITLNTREALLRLQAVHDSLLAINDNIDPNAVARGELPAAVAGRAQGGPVHAGTQYEVGEGDHPELLNQDGKLFLIPGNQGRVTPIANTTGSGGDGGVNIYGDINMGSAGAGEVGDEIMWRWRTRRAS